MNDFVIRESSAAAQTWATAIAQTKPGLGEWILGEMATRGAMRANLSAFNGFFNDNMKALDKFVPVKDKAAFMQAAADKLEEITTATFEKAPKVMTKSEAHAVLSTANANARKEIQSLASTFMRSTAAWEGQVDAATAAPSAAPVPTSFSQAKKDLSQYLDVRFDRLGASVPPGQQKDFQAAIGKLEKSLHAELDKAAVTAEAAAQKARQAMGVLVDAHSGGMPASSEAYVDTLREKYQEAIRNVQIAAQRAIIDLTGLYARPDVRPQVHVASDGTINVLRKAPTLENLVLAGGGAKGVGNPPALRELAATGMISGLKQVVGTSAGALTASVLASGMSTSDFETLMDSTPMTDLKKDVANFSTLYPQMGLTAGLGSTKDRLLLRAGAMDTVDHSAQAAVQLLDQQTMRGVHAYVSANRDAILAGVPAKITQQQAERLLNTFSDAPDFTANRTGKMVTFGDLAALHALKPETFKELTLTGWNVTDQRESFFNAQNSPDMPVAYAGRISMSIPIYFQAAEFGGKQYVDGGVGSNVPSEVVTTGKAGAALEETRAKTMLMVFDDKGQAFATQATTGRLDGAPPKRNENVAHGIMQRTTGVDFAGTEVADKVKTHASGPNVHVVFHGKVDTFDLSASEAQKAFAKQAATLRTLEQIQARQNQAYQVSVPDMGALMNTLSVGERRAIAEGAAPAKAQYPRPQDLAAATELYDLCVAQFREERIEQER